MEILLVFIFACYGLSNMVVFSNGPFDMLKGWRNLTNKIHPKLGELFSCMMCFPTWVGMGLSAINLFFVTDIPFTPMNSLCDSYIVDYNTLTFFVIILIDGAIASGSSWVIHNIEEYFERGNLK